MNYIPSRDGDMVVWGHNMIAKITSHAPALELTEEDLETININLHILINTISDLQTADIARNAAVVAKDNMEKTQIPYFRNLVRNWKMKEKYTHVIGKDLDILNTSTPIDFNFYKAKITLNVIANLVRIKFVKEGVDSLNIYKRKKGAENWIFLARDTSSPYDDHIVLAIAGRAEQWEYRAIGVKEDKEVGSPSDIAETIYGG